MTRALIVAPFLSAPCWAEEAKESAAEVAVPIEAASNAQKDAAVKLYRQGLEHFDAKAYDKALEGFRASLAKVDSPNSRLMVARTLDKLDRVAEAYEEFERVLAEATALAQAVKKYESTRDAAHTELGQLRQRVAIVHVEADGRVTLDGKELAAPERPKLVLAPGEVTLALTLENGEKVEKRLTLAAGAEETVVLTLPAPAPPAEPGEAPPPTVEVRRDPNTVSRDTLGYVGLGVAGAGTVGFVVFGLMTQSRFDELEANCPDGLCAAGLRDDAESGRFYQTMANVSLGVGAVGLVTGLYFLLSGDPDGASAELAAEGTSFVVGPSEVIVRGRF